MSNKDIDSPDVLQTSTTRNPGRRLNKVPLYFVGAILVLGIFALSYTMNQRSQENRKKPANEQEKIASASKPAVNPTTTGIIPAAQTEEKKETEAQTPNPNNKRDEKPQIPLETEAQKKRRLLIERIESQKIALYEASLKADTTVESFHNSKKAEGGSGDSSLATQLALSAAKKASGPNQATSLKQDSDTANGQDQKRAFLSAEADDDTYLNHTLKAPHALTQEIKAGTIVPGVMISGLNSDLPGNIIAQVRENVYDSATGSQLLIPAGSRLFGSYNSSVTYGQERALVAWARIIFPDSSSITLNTMPGTDVSGYAGFNDQVNNHYWRIFGNSLLVSLFSAGIQLSQPQSVNGQNVTSQQTVAASIGQQMGELGKGMSEKNMNIQPTIEIRPGYQFNIIVTKDMILPTWAGHPMAK